MQSWQTKSSKVVYENPWMTVYEDHVIRPDGKDGLYGYASSKSDSVFIVPIDSDGDIYLIQQKRYTTKETLWEIPAGKTDGEDIASAARRELLEETGLFAEDIRVVTDIYTTPGMSTFHGHICIATGLAEQSGELDEEEGILRVQKTSLKDVITMILSGEMKAASSISAIFVAREIISQETP